MLLFVLIFAPLVLLELRERNWPVTPNRWCANYHRAHLVKLQRLGGESIYRCEKCQTYTRVKHGVPM
jgi:hypothetical protein